MPSDKQTEVIRTVIARFPATFGLSAFPGLTFRISERASYFPRMNDTDESALQLYTEVLRDGEWMEFAKGHVWQLEQTIRPIAALAPVLRIAPPKRVRRVASGFNLKHVRNSTDSTDGLFMVRDGMSMRVLEIAYWEELDSSAVPLYGKYNVQSGYVALDNVDANIGALKSYGWHVTSEGIENDSGDIIAAVDTEAYWLCLADALWSHGAKDVACDVSGNNLRKLVKQARGAL